MNRSQDRGYIVQIDVSEDPVGHGAADRDVGGKERDCHTLGWFRTRRPTDRGTGRSGAARSPDPDRYGYRTPGGLRHAPSIMPLKLLPFCTKRPSVLEYATFPPTVKTSLTRCDPFSRKEIALVGVLGSDEGAVLVGVGSREIKQGTVVAPGDRQGVVGREAGLEHLPAVIKRCRPGLRSAGPQLSPVPSQSISPPGTQGSEVGTPRLSASPCP